MRHSLEEKQQYRRGPWHGWYNLASHKRRRAYQLRLEPLCVQCLRENRITPATIADHITPHKGNFTLFKIGPLQSLCKQCHDQDKHIKELKGFSNKCNAQGWPIDPNHPWNKSQ